MCRFVRSEEDDSSDSWEVRMARRYYAKLFKEYAIADLSRYKVRILCITKLCTQLTVKPLHACILHLIES